MSAYHSMSRSDRMLHATITMNAQFGMPSVRREIAARLATIAVGIPSMPATRMPAVITSNGRLSCEIRRNGCLSLRKTAPPRIAARITSLSFARIGEKS